MPHHRGLPDVSRPGHPLTSLIEQLAEVLQHFQERHRNLIETFAARADEMEEAFASHATFTKEQRLLVGAYFLHEYSFEAAALFNPSIVDHPDQSAAPPGGSLGACRTIPTIATIRHTGVPRKLVAYWPVVVVYWHCMQRAAMECARIGGDAPRVHPTKPGFIRGHTSRGKVQ